MLPTHQELAGAAVGVVGGGEVLGGGEEDRFDAARFEEFGEVAVAGEEEDLPFGAGEVDQQINRAEGALFVEIDEDVIENDGKVDSLTGELLDDGEADGEEELFAGAARELLDVPGLTLFIIDVGIALAKGSPDVAVAASCESREVS